MQMSWMGLILDEDLSLFGMKAGRPRLHTTK
jgi:hypothetical protein